jgi:hypothetical protein
MLVSKIQKESAESTGQFLLSGFHGGLLGSTLDFYKR